MVDCSDIVPPELWVRLEQLDPEDVRTRCGSNTSEHRRSKSPDVDHGKFRLDVLGGAYLLDTTAKAMGPVDDSADLFFTPGLCLASVMYLIGAQDIEPA